MKKTLILAISLLFLAASLAAAPGAVDRYVGDCDSALTVRTVPHGWSFHPAQGPLGFSSRVVINFFRLDGQDYQRFPLDDDNFHYEPTGFDFVAVKAIVTAAGSDVVVARYEGRWDTADSGARIDFEWDGRDLDGEMMPPGAYELAVRSRMVPRGAASLDYGYDELDHVLGLIEGCGQVMEIELSASERVLAPEGTTCPSEPGTYWDTAIAAEGNQANLRNAINAIISGHTVLPYSSGGTDTWVALNDIDENPADPTKVLQVYRNYGVADGCVGGCTSLGADSWNREHVWAKSYGFPNETGNGDPYTDLHHLHCSDVGYNGNRGNKMMDDCPGACTEYTTFANNGFGGGPADVNRTNASVWEPWPHRKGDMARSLMYMDVRYAGAGAEVNLTLINTQPGAGSPQHAFLDTLYAWHVADPPDADEIRRNDQTWCYQGNRNPFVDHPEWADCVFNGVCTPPVPPPLFGGITNASDISTCNVTGIQLNWSTVTDWQDTCSPCTRGYRVYRDNVEISSGLCVSPRAEGAVSCVDDAATPDTVHSYRVEAFNDAGATEDGGVSLPAGDYSGVSSAPVASPPSICTGASTTLSANPSGGLAPYTFSWRIPPAGPFTTSENPTVSPTSTTTYEVVVTDDLLCTSTPQLVNVTVTAGVPPAPPSLVTVTGQATQVVVNWDDVLGGVGNYLIYRADGPCTAGYSYLGTVASPATAYIDTTVTPGVSSCYKVSSQDASCEGNLSSCGAASCTTPGAVPEVSPAANLERLRIAEIGAGTQFRFQWVGGGYDYHLYVAADEAAMDAGVYSTKFCDLENNAEGTYATDGISWVTWTLADGTMLPDDENIQVVAQLGAEGVYGYKSSGDPRGVDTDRTGTVDVGCPVIVGCAAELFFSEYIEGSGLNKAIEVYNGTGGPVDLAAGLYDIQGWHDADGFAKYTIPLTGVVADGDVFVLADSGSVDANIVAAADMTSGAGLWNGNDTVLLRKNGVIVDSIGQNQGNVVWGSGAVTTQNDTLRRKGTVISGDTDDTDAYDPVPEWDGFAQDDTSNIGTHSPSACSDCGVELFFSEYVEGSGLNKAVEVFNGTGVAVDLDAGVYDIQGWHNTDGFAKYTIPLTGTLADGDVYVLADVGAAAAILAVADDTSSDGLWNGDDTVLLRKGGAIIDSIGRNQEAVVWGSGAVTTQNDTLRRKVSVGAGDTNDTDTYDPTVEWDGFPQDDFSGLGSHTLSCGGGTCPTELFISQYQEGSGSNKCVEIFNGTGASIDLSAGGYVLEGYHNGAVTPTYSIALVGTIVDGDVFVLSDSGAANATIIAESDQSQSGLWNGDDAIVLRKGAAAIDSIGQVGVQQVWGTTPVTTQNDTLRRKASVLGGDTDPSDVYDPVPEWDGFPQDDATDLGSHSVTGCP